MFSSSFQTQDDESNRSRNELAAILMMAQLAYVTKKSLGDRVGQIIYLTDSTIAFGMDQKPNN